ncbi:MAG TPA: PAS domain S-box protein [Mucilaginibacter sp.]
MKGSENTAIKSEFFDQLRKRAEHMLQEEGFTLDAPQFIETQKLFQELQVHQLELEMQNDELNLVTFELENERAKFSSLFEMAPVGYAVINRKGTIVDINQAGSRLFGLRRELLLNKALRAFVFADDAHKFYGFFRKMLSEIGEQNCQVRLFKSGETAFYAQLHGICIAKGNMNNCYITISDISEKKRAELELQRARQRLDAALSASLTGTFEIRLPLGEIFLDNFSKTIFGIEPNDFDGKYSSLMRLINKADQEVVDAALRTTMVRGKDFNIEFSIHTPSRERKYINARGQVVYEDEQSRIAGTVMDITEKKLMELESSAMKERQQQEIRAASLQAEENARRSISESLHDSVGQILYALKINMELLKCDSIDPHYTQASELLTRAISEVRNLSFELAPAILKDFGIVATIEEMARRLSTDGLSVKLKSTFSGNTEMQLMVNIYRIVQELVNNSIKHAEASQVNIELFKKKSDIHIEVRDNGKGFRPGKPSAKPTGTGLSSIRNRLTVYNGSMNIESVPGKGTSVSIRLKQ